MEKMSRISKVSFVFLFSGRMPPKQIVRREPGDNSSSSSDSFDHLTRPIRDHGLPSDSRMVWGSEPYPQSESVSSVTAPKGRDDNKEPRYYKAKTNRRDKLYFLDITH